MGKPSPCISNRDMSIRRQRQHNFAENPKNVGRRFMHTPTPPKCANILKPHTNNKKYSPIQRAFPLHSANSFRAHKNVRFGHLLSGERVLDVQEVSRGHTRHTRIYGRSNVTTSVWLAADQHVCAPNTFLCVGEISTVSDRGFEHVARLRASSCDSKDASKLFQQKNQHLMPPH